MVRQKERGLSKREKKREKERERAVVSVTGRTRQTDRHTKSSVKVPEDGACKTLMWKSNKSPGFD